MIEITKAEEQILYLLWKLGEGTVQDVIALIDKEKKPSRTTVSTVIRILESKKAVGHKPSGKRGFIYYPILTKEAYSRHQLFRFVQRYFDNSFSSLTSFFAKESNMSLEELEVLLEEAKKELKETTNNPE